MQDGGFTHMLQANLHFCPGGEDENQNELMVEDEEDDGLPKTCEANDILIKKKSSDRLLDSPILPEPDEPTFQLATKHSSKSRSFAEPHEARQSVKLFGNSFGKGSRDGKNHYSSFLSVNNPDTIGTKKLSSRSNNSGRLRR